MPTQKPNMMYESPDIYVFQTVNKSFGFYRDIQDLGLYESPKMLATPCVLVKSGHTYHRKNF